MDAAEAVVTWRAARSEGEASPRVSYGYDEGYRYEVQLLTEDGEGGAFVLFRGDESPLQCPEYPIPDVVFRAAFGRSGNPGDYVTSAGEIVDFNGRPVA